MSFRIVIAAGAVLVLCAAGGCATGGGTSAQPTFMQKCLDSATTEQERSECAWSNASRMASGR